MLASMGWGLFVAIAFVAACGDDRTSTPLDAAPVDATRTVRCDRAGTATVSGGELDGAHVYAQVFNGFCGNLLVLTITHDDPLQDPLRSDSAVVRVSVPDLAGTTEFAGTYAATIEAPDRTKQATGTLEITAATPTDAMPTFVRATVTVSDVWQLTATVDIPYCDVTTCL